MTIVQTNNSRLQLSQLVDEKIANIRPVGQETGSISTKGLLKALFRPDVYFLDSAVPLYVDVWVIIRRTKLPVSAGTVHYACIPRIASLS